MAKLWAVIKREYIERVRTRWFVIGSLLGPIFFSAMIFLPAWLAMRNSAATSAGEIIILDATGAGLGARVRDALHSVGTTRGAIAMTGNTQLRVVDPSGLPRAESLATLDVVHKRTQGYLVLDQYTLRGDSAHYAGRNATSIADVQRIESAVRQTVLALRLEREGLDPKRIDSLTRPRLNLATEMLSERGRGGSASANIAFAVGVAFLLYMAIVLYGQAVLRGVMEEKQTRVAEVVISSVKPETLLAGKVIGVGAVGLTQQIIWVIATMYIGSYAAPVLARMSAASNAATAGAAPMRAGASAAIATAFPDVSLGAIALILLFFLLGYTFYSSLYAAVGSTVNSEQEAQQALAPVLVLIISSALLIQPVLLNPASTLARVASMIPISAAIIMPLRMSLVQVPASDMAIAIVGLAISCALVVWLAARIYRVGLLMYGKRPTFGEMAKWVRYA
jgi:ABC-2 type transport system permease protein